MKERGYQGFAVDSLFRFFTEHETGNPVLAMPTGTGKSIVIGGFIKRVMTTWPTQRLMMLTHVKELIEQNAEKLQTMWPQAPIGIYSAGLGKKVANYPITFAGIQSAYRYPALFGHIDLVLIDECHLVSPNANTSYQSFLAALKVVNPNLRVIGLSATAYRLGLGMITEGGIFTDIACDMTTMDGFNWFVDEGYLAPLIPRPTETKIDLDGVRSRGGEFVEGDIQKAVDKAAITEAALRECLETAHDRQRILVFATGVEHAEHIREALEALGESAVCVHSKMKGNRAEALASHSSGRVRWLINNNVLTTGYDDPGIDCIVMLRPTQSPGLWVQMLGRGTRPLYADGFDLETTAGRLGAQQASEKQNCLVLDFAGNTMRLGPINDPVIPKKKGKGGGEPPIKFCEREKIKAENGCGAYNHTSARFCCQCGAEFIFAPKIVNTASVAELIKRDVPQVEEFMVDKVTYMVHEKRGGVNSMKVTYHAGVRKFSEWVPAWHESGVKYKGLSWWKERTDEDLPESPEEAVDMADILKQPRAVKVWINKKYPEVIGHVF